jgi:hypothetical protein
MKWDGIDMKNRRGWNGRKEEGRICIKCGEFINASAGHDPGFPDQCEQCVEDGLHGERDDFKKKQDEAIRNLRKKP